MGLDASPSPGVTTLNTQIVAPDRSARCAAWANASSATEEKSVGNRMVSMLSIGRGTESETKR
jgi:hypothetical protein